MTIGTLLLVTLVGFVTIWSVLGEIEYERHRELGRLSAYGMALLGMILSLLVLVGIGLVGALIAHTWSIPL